ncbi:hypothetical protein BC832DRAFT_540249 [Gaertneriomyces semiglobifer]|nr:hypothetical protein BC832DRAFT_540249 [Gaertneriomyces semiglobifer]
MENLSKLTVPLLKARCREPGLIVGGKKSDLIARIQAAIAAVPENPIAPTSVPASTPTNVINTPTGGRKLAAKPKKKQLPKPHVSEVHEPIATNNVPNVATVSTNAGVPDNNDGALQSLGEQVAQAQTVVPSRSPTKRRKLLNHPDLPNTPKPRNPKANLLTPLREPNVEVASTSGRPLDGARAPAQSVPSSKVNVRVITPIVDLASCEVSQSASRESITQRTVSDGASVMKDPVAQQSLTYRKRISKHTPGSIHPSNQPRPATTKGKSLFRSLHVRPVTPVQSLVDTDGKRHRYEPAGSRLFAHDAGEKMSMFDFVEWHCSNWFGLLYARHLCRVNADYAVNDSLCGIAPAVINSPEVNARIARRFLISMIMRRFRGARPMDLVERLPVVKRVQVLCVDIARVWTHDPVAVDLQKDNSTEVKPAAGEVSHLIILHTGDIISTMDADASDLPPHWQSLVTAYQDAEVDSLFPSLLLSRVLTLDPRFPNAIHCSLRASATSVYSRLVALRFILSHCEDLAWALQPHDKRTCRTALPVLSHPPASAVSSVSFSLSRHNKKRLHPDLSIVQTLDAGAIIVLAETGHSIGTEDDGVS